jgi:excisionase family DNA binding protein
MLNVKQAAEYLGATVSFVRHEEWAKRLPSVTFGKRLMVDQRYLDQYIEAAKVPA